MNNLIVIDSDKPILHEDMVAKVIEVEDKIKYLKAIQDDYKKAILSAMEKKNILKISDDITGLTISYIEAKENLEKFNQSKFKEDYPDLYDQYVTLDGKKSAYITIKLK